MDRLENFVHGKTVAPLSGRYMPVVNPANGETYVEAPLSGPEDVDAACQAAARAFRSWRRVTPAERSLLLFRIADALEPHADELVAAEANNTGKPRNSLRDGEIPGILDNLRFFAA